MTETRQLSICCQAEIIAGGVCTPATSSAPAEHYEICSACERVADGCFNVTPCPGCNGELGPHTAEDGIFECELCGGLVSGDRREPVDRDKVEKYVQIGEWYINGVSEAQNKARYFDFMVKYPDGDVRRVHGWFHEDIKTVIQFG